MSTLTDEAPSESEASIASRSSDALETSTSPEDAHETRALRCGGVDGQTHGTPKLFL